jgi:hypothetical protein
MLIQTYDHEIQVHPGRDDRAAGNGWSCAELLFILHDLSQPGAATFAVRTNWLPATMERGVIRPSASLTPIDLIFHFAVPTMTATQDKRDICPYIGGVCHSITDRKNGQFLVGVLQAEGSAAVWREIEKLFEQEARIQRPRIRGGS